MLIINSILMIDLVLLFFTVICFNFLYIATIDNDFGTVYHLGNIINIFMLFVILSLVIIVSIMISLFCTIGLIATL